MDGLTVHLQPSEPEAVPEEKVIPEKVYENALDDPSMYPGGKLPQWDTSDATDK